MGLGDWFDETHTVCRSVNEWLREKNFDGSQCVGVKVGWHTGPRHTARGLVSWRADHTSSDVRAADQPTCYDYNTHCRSAHDQLTTMFVMAKGSCTPDGTLPR